MAVILDGKATTTIIMEELAAQIETLKQKGVTPGLALVLTGEDKNSARYVKLKKRRAEKIGIYVEYYQLHPCTQEQLEELVHKLNKDPAIHGIMVQLPLTEGLDELAAVDAIIPEKDVDGLSPNTLGKILMGEEAYLPAGVEAIIELLARHDIQPTGKHWVVVGSSNFLSKPLVAYLANIDAKVTLVNEKDDYTDLLKDADVVSVEVFRKHAVTANMLKEGVIVIDNGNNYEGKKVYGDVDYEQVSAVASAITPVPGGVGPMLIAMLLKNTVQAARKSSV